MVFSAIPAVAAEADYAFPGAARELSLAESIAIALRNNVTIEASYLERIAQKFDLKVAEDKFYPKLTFNSSFTRSSHIPPGDPLYRTGALTDLTTFSADVATLLPTGGRIDVSASRSLEQDKNTPFFGSHAWSVNLTQPLLKGGGIDVATASVKVARFDEKMNIQSFKGTLMDTVTSVISAYRSYLQAWKLVEISRQSLERAIEIVEMNKSLIAAGRMAKAEIVQTEADVTSREINLLAAINNAETARLSLMGLLRMDRNTQILPTEQFKIESASFEYEKCRSMAFSSRPDYLSSLLEVEKERLKVLLAKNNRLWDISLLGGIGRTYASGGIEGRDDSAKTWNAGIRLTVPFGDLEPRQGYVRARVGQEKAELFHAKVKEDIDIEIQNSLRDVEMKLKQAKLAQKSRDLYERKLVIEREKLTAGRSTNFQLVIAQNDLFYAQSFELTSLISYFNALTSLDRTLGITLEKWGIAMNERYNEERYGVGSFSLRRVMGW